MSGDLPPGCTQRDIDSVFDYEEDCCECDGSGWIEGECFEDTCCCADPERSHGLVRCSCNPKGKP